MLKLQFNRVRNIPAGLEGMNPEPQDGFDLGIVHTLPPVVNGEIVEWATLEEVVQDIKTYNEQFPGEGFNPDPAFVAYSLNKAVEAGLLNVRVMDAKPVVAHELVVEVREYENELRNAIWWLDGRKLLTMTQVYNIDNQWGRCMIFTAAVTDYCATTISYIEQAFAEAKAQAQEWERELV